MYVLINLKSKLLVWNCQKVVSARFSSKLLNTNWDELIFLRLITIIMVIALVVPKRILRCHGCPTATITPIDPTLLSHRGRSLSSDKRRVTLTYHGVIPQLSRLTHMTNLRICICIHYVARIKRLGNMRTWGYEIDHATSTHVSAHVHVCYDAATLIRDNFMAASVFRLFISLKAVLSQIMSHVYTTVLRCIVVLQRVLRRLSTSYIYL